SGGERDRRVLHRRLAAGAYREIAQSSLRAGGDGRGLDHAVLRLRALAARAHLGLCRRTLPAQDGRCVMAIAILNIYLVILFLLVHFKIVRFNLFWKVSPFLVMLLTLLGLLVPMGWGAPQGSALVVRNAVSIVPDVAGEVTDVPVAANTPLKAGD